MVLGGGINRGNRYGAVRDFGCFSVLPPNNSEG
jgi:hypothetical protein